MDSKLEKGSELKGKMVVREHTFDMAVNSRKGEDLNGICEWPTLDNTITKWKGSIINNHEIEITEFEAMEGDGVELPNVTFLPYWLFLSLLLNAATQRNRNIKERRSRKMAALLLWASSRL